MMQRMKRAWLMAACWLTATWALGQTQAVNMDSVELSLLTCQPHEEIYSLYGHTAIRYHNLRTREDIVFNYGVFNYNKPHFVLRFVFGLTDYELGVAPFDGFCAYYRKWGSMVMEQKLNLTNEEKLKMQQALAINLKPENRVYRYNFFYDNCSTRPRDIIERIINGRVIYEPRPDYTPTYREIVHHCTANHPWVAMGNDMLLGVRADLKITQRQQEFLPGNLLYDFDHARIQNPDGTFRPLVSKRTVVVPSGVQTIESDFPLSPTVCALILLVVSLLIFALEYKQKKTYRWWDASLMLAQGLAGCILFVMLFSQHPTTSTNLQLFLLNPLPLFFIPSVLRRRKTIYFRLLLIMLVLFFLGAIWQDYAEGMEIVALCLLLRCMKHFKA